MKPELPVDGQSGCSHWKLDLTSTSRHPNLVEQGLLPWWQVNHSHLRKVKINEFLLQTLWPLKTRCKVCLALAELLKKAGNNRSLLFQFYSLWPSASPLVSSNPQSHWGQWEWKAQCLLGLLPPPMPDPVMVMFPVEDWAVRAKLQTSGPITIKVISLSRISVLQEGLWCWGSALGWEPILDSTLSFSTNSLCHYEHTLLWASVFSSIIWS